MAGSARNKLKRTRGDEESGGDEGSEEFDEEEGEEDEDLPALKSVSKAGASPAAAAAAATPQITLNRYLEPAAGAAAAATSGSPSKRPAVGGKEPRPKDKEVDMPASAAAIAPHSLLVLRSVQHPLSPPPPLLPLVRTGAARV